MGIVLEIPFFAARRAHEHLIAIRRRFCEDIKIPEKSSWPSVKTLLLLRLLSLTFPCSDFHHPVMTPAILLMCEYLVRCPIVYGRDVAVGSFLCSMVLSGHHLMELKTSKPWLLIQDHTIEMHPIDFFMVIHMDVDSPNFLTDNFKVRILVSLVDTLRGFGQIYEKLSSFPEIFLPLSDLLHEMLQKANLPILLQGDVRHAIDLIKTKSDEYQMLRQPLQMRKQKPVPIGLLNPKFEESFVKGRDYDPDRERAERKKLKKLLKSEAKGAVRELRKDNQFIFGLKERDRLLQEEERAEKYGKAMAFLQEQ